MGKNGKYDVGEYSFSTNSDYNRALKEKETISYIMANTDITDMKEVLKVYNMSVEKKSFQTVIGIEFVKNMRRQLIASGIVSGDTIANIPVPKPADNKQKTSATDSNMAAEKIEKYKLAYENARSGRTIRNMVICFLLVIIIVMLVITYNSQYSVFTYFTNYKSDMENELIDKYENWESELEERERQLEEREKALSGGNSISGSGS